LLVDPPANTATNHLVHGHLLASHGCCSSAPPHLSSCSCFTAQFGFALLSMQVWFLLISIKISFDMFASRTIGLKSKQQSCFPISFTVYDFPLF
ncbi:hypothetical protein EE612_038940, partial [Oryza sativa]